MNQEKQDRVLFLYVRDKNEPRRVMTLARFKKDNLLTFAWSINKVTIDIVEIHHRMESLSSKHVIVHDTFRKAMGRKIAEARLSDTAKSITIELAENERPLRAMLETLAGLNPKVGKMPVSVQRLAQQALEGGIYLAETPDQAV